MTYSRSSPSPRYLELLDLYRQLHAEGDKLNNLAAEQTFSGISLKPHIPVIGALVRQFGARSLLDYGAGKGDAYRLATAQTPDGQTLTGLKEIWGLDRIALYDPGYEVHGALPEGRFDAVISTDMLEHCPAEDLDWIIAEMMGYATKFVFMTVAVYPAKKKLPTGENAHITLESPGWWVDKVEKARKTFPSIRYYLVVIHGDKRMVMVEG